MMIWHEFIKSVILADQTSVSGALLAITRGPKTLCTNNHKGVNWLTLTGAIKLTGEWRGCQQSTCLCTPTQSSGEVQSAKMSENTCVGGPQVCKGLNVSGTAAKQQTFKCKEIKTAVQYIIFSTTSVFAFFEFDFLTTWARNVVFLRAESEIKEFLNGEVLHIHNSKTQWWVTLTKTEM